MPWRPLRRRQRARPRFPPTTRRNSPRRSPRTGTEEEEMTAPVSSAYFDVIAQRESGGVTPTFGLTSEARYEIVNTLDYLGKYQIGNAALIEAGFYTGAGSGDGVQVWDDTKWTALAHSFGVASRSDFLSHAAAQEQAIRSYTDSQWDQLVELGLDTYVGTTKNGLVITAEGLLAGAHLRGADGVYDYLTSGIDATDEYGTPVSEYLALFPGATTIASSSAGSLTLTSGGNITQSAPFAVSGMTNLQLGSNAIPLASSGNDLGGAVTLTGTGGITLASGGTLTPAAITPAG